MVKEVRNIRRQVLPHGLTVITEQMEHIRSASIGIWLETGSRDETPQSNGISHFIEHMVFKGTRHRTAEEIARQVDSIGGNMDAFTSKECICFNVKVLDEHVPVALDILTDLVLYPTFTAVRSMGRLAVPESYLCGINWVGGCSSWLFAPGRGSGWFTCLPAAER